MSTPGELPNNGVTKPSPYPGMLRAVMSGFGTAKGPLIWIFVCLSGASLIAAGILLGAALSANAKIRALHLGRDIAVDAAKSPAPVLEARSDFLLKRDRIDDAQPLLDQAVARAPHPILERMLYKMANARMRASIKAIEDGKYDKAIPLTALAKSEYRRALGIDPSFWDAKYNLDVAMRLVRDLPVGQGEDKEPVKLPSKLWTDLPGVPTGLP
jgi:mxaK protein